MNKDLTTIDATKLLRKLPTGIYYWDSETQTFCDVRLEPKIVMRKSIFCVKETK